MAIDPKSLTPSMVSSVQTKTGSYHYTFALSLFLFSLSSFPNVKHLIISFVAITFTMAII
jgi:hypothetical protein